MALEGKDVLDSVLSHVPSVDILPCLHVSISWRRSALASILRRHSRPLLLIHLLSRRGNVRRGQSVAYDPYTRSWNAVPHLISPPPITCSFLSLAVPFQPLADMWHRVPPPMLYRRDALVGLVGHHIVLAGGSCGLGERTCSAECLSLESASSEWKSCEPMPEALRESAAATWLAVAASDSRMYFLERGPADAARLAWFEPAADRWSPVRPVRLGGGALRISAVGLFGDGRLIVVGLADGGGVRFREVDPESLVDREIGSLPVEVVNRIAGEAVELPPTIGFSNVGGFGYLYDVEGRGEVFACEFGDGKWSWEAIGRPRQLEDDPTAKVIFGCAVPTLKNLTVACGSI